MNWEKTRATLIEYGVDQERLPIEFEMGIDLTNLSLAGINLKGAWLAYANLKRTNLTGANLEKAKLQNADTSNTRMYRINLHAADLSSTNLTNAWLEQANLTQANMEDAVLHNAALKRADITGALISYASWPISCGSLNVKMDVEQNKQFLYHTLINASPEMRAQPWFAEAAKFANTWEEMEYHQLRPIDTEEK